MENPFNQQQAPQERIVTRQEVLGALIEDRENNGSSNEILGRFIDQLIEQVENRSLGDFNYNLTLAELYAEAAERNPIWADLAGDSYYDAARLALQAGDEQLYQELLGKHRRFSA